VWLFTIRLMPCFIHQNVYAQAFIEPYAIELERDGFLPFNRQTALLERFGQHDLVHGFQQPGPQIAMNPKRLIHDDRFDSFHFHLLLPFPFPFPFAPSRLRVSFSSSPRPSRLRGFA
jgi:hypothetical protein